MPKISDKYGQLFVCVYWFSKCIRCCVYASLNGTNEICVLITLFFLNIKKENSFIAKVNFVFPSSLTIDINWAKLDNNEELFCQLSGLKPTQSCLTGNLRGVCVMHAGMVFWLSCVFITRKVFFNNNASFLRAQTPAPAHTHTQ